MDVNNANVVVILFVLEQCPHCHDYYPKFVEAAKKYTHYFPVWVLNANDPEYSELADKYQITATPSIVITKRGAGAVKIEGTQDEAQTEAILKMALRHAKGE